jgi:5-methylcytosine-specific restriction protein B
MANENIKETMRHDDSVGKALEKVRADQPDGNLEKMLDGVKGRNIFDLLVEEYQKHIGKGSQHCLIGENNEFYKGKTGIKKLADDFIKESGTKEAFEAFWKRDLIYSAQQASNATNLLKKNGVGELQQGIKTITGANGDIETITGAIRGAKNSALEFYYYYQIEEDEFPLLNAGTRNGVRMLEAIGVFDDSQEKPLDELKKFKILRDKVSPEKEDGCCGMKRYYLLDQFLNLLDKVTLTAVRQAAEEHRLLYLLAYLITFWQNNKHHGNSFSDRFDELLKIHKNIIFYGAPGTGKTFLCEENIKRIVNDDKNRYQVVQFHASYGYEDFMEGLKPQVENGQVTLELTEGDFKAFCKRAAESGEKKPYFFLVDEINRAELSRVFGELMYALEKRGREHGITTQYDYMRPEADRAKFYVPENLYFIGTMNDVDKSIDSFDLALRRRFLWERLECDYGVIENELMKLGVAYENATSYAKACEALNTKVTQAGSDALDLGALYEIGHAYFLRIKEYVADKDKPIKNSHLGELFDHALEPLLKEYMRSEYDEKAVEDKLAALRKDFKLKAQ